MESEYVKSTIQGYNTRINALIKRKKALRRENARLMETADRINNIFGDSFTKLLLEKRFQKLKGEYMSCYEEQRSLELLRDSTIFYTKYDAKNNKDIIDRMAGLNKQVRVDQEKRERMFGNTKVKKLERKYWIPPKVNNRIN